MASTLCQGQLNSLSLFFVLLEMHLDALLAFLSIGSTNDVVAVLLVAGPCFVGTTRNGRWYLICSKNNLDQIFVFFLVFEAARLRIFHGVVCV